MIKHVFYALNKYKNEIKANLSKFKFKHRFMCQ